MIILVIFAMIIIFLIWRIFVGISYFNVPINEANKEKERLKQENDELQEKWYFQNTTDDKIKKLKRGYKDCLISLYYRDFFKSFKNYVIDNIDKEILHKSLKVNYANPCHLINLGKDNNEIKNRFEIVLYVEYSFDEVDNNDIHETGYFVVAGDNRSMRVLKIATDELPKYGIGDNDCVKYELIKKQLMELFDNASAEDIIAEWNRDFTKITSNSLQISSLDKNIMKLKNAKMAAIVSGLAAGAAACKAIDKAKNKKK